MLAHLPKKIYLIGIKGTGLSSLAVILKKLGHQVTGSDTAERFFTESQLQKNKIKYFENFSAGNLERARPDLIIASTAYLSAKQTAKNHHPELAAARQQKIKLISYPEALGLLSRRYFSVAISGSHGKTTTTAMLGSILDPGGQTLTLVGSVMNNLNRRLRRPKFFVFEADEYQNKLRYFSPRHLILTNLDLDHPDFFKSQRQYEKIFSDFIAPILKRGGKIIFNHDDYNSRRLLARFSYSRILSFGFHPQALYRLEDINRQENGFVLRGPDHFSLPLQLTVFGRHNLLNAAASALMAKQLGCSDQIIQQALKKFRGAKRRMEKIPHSRYFLLDDYGHHPTEISATLAAIKNKYGNKKIVTVFHPHTFSRTQKFLKPFGQSFGNADLTIVLDIYASARENKKDFKIHARDLVEEIKQNGSRALYRPTLASAAAYLKKHASADTLILTLGAGDVWKLKNYL